MDFLLVIREMSLFSQETNEPVACSDASLKQAGLLGMRLTCGLSGNTHTGEIYIINVLIL